MRHESKRRLRLRRGLSIIELIIGMVILAIIGMALSRVFVSQARYFSHQKNANLARNVSRGPLNRVVSDLRMVEAIGGVLSASDTSILARIPYAMGVVCANVSSETHISLLPVDSAMFAAPGFAGYAWRTGEGKYRYVETGPPIVSLLGDLNVCNVALINSLTAQNAKIIKISPALVDTASVGTPVFLFRRIIYSFQPSLAVSGTRGLFRTVVATGETEELAAPFENSARFRFFVMSDHTSQTAPPADLSTLRGIELVLNGMSEEIASGSISNSKAPFITAVFFKNRLD
jgi:prepilin-type N-terminal cleavage/methylation domain-containing protein